MPLDAITMTAAAEEPRSVLMGGKVDKIYQPTRDEVVLHMRAGGGNVKLLLSANPAHPRAQLTEISRENPETPPMFCMLLRKHFVGGRILDISQPPMERLLEFKFETLNDLGDRVERRLVLECIGRKSNLIMLDGAGRITDCMRRVDADISAQRPLMPGLFYELPTPTGKLDPTAMPADDLRQLVLAQAPEGDGQDGWLLDTFSGISPLIARELEFRADGSREKLANRLERLVNALSFDNTGSLCINGSCFCCCNSAFAIDGLSECVYNSAEHSVPYRNFYDSACAANFVAFFDFTVITEDNATYVVFFKVEDHAVDFVREFNKFTCHSLVEAVDSCDTVTNLNNSTVIRSFEL